MEIVWKATEWRSMALLCRGVPVRRRFEGRWLGRGSREGEAANFSYALVKKF